MKKGMKMKRLLAGLMAMCCVAVCSAADAANVVNKPAPEPLATADIDLLGLVTSQGLANATHLPGKGFHLLFPVADGGMVAAVMLVESEQFNIFHL